MNATPDDPADSLADALEIIERRTKGIHVNDPLLVDVALVRRRIGMTQERFAASFGVPVATLRHWEHGDRQPRGPALVLLNVIARNPNAVLRALGHPHRVKQRRVFRRSLKR